MLQTIQNFKKYLRPSSSIIPDKTDTTTDTTSNKTMNAVSELNEYAQKYGTNKVLPKYDVTDKMVGTIKQFIAKCSFEEHVVCGKASSKKEARRLAAVEMLKYVQRKNGTNDTPKTVQTEHVISNKLEDFDRSKLDVFLDKFLDNREKDYSKFRRLFVGDMPENTNSTEEQFQINDEIDVESPKSKTLDGLKKTGVGVINLTNACHMFKTIVQEMKLIYHAEFQETSGNDRYNVIIKLNKNLFTFSECGTSPEEAIQAACKDAIEKLDIFNQ